MPNRKELREKFQQKAGEAFDAMFDADQQEQLITLVQREDRVLEKGADLQAWLLQQHLKADPLGDPQSSERLRCPRCGAIGERASDEEDPVPRRVTTRAGQQELQRWKYRCPSCRKVFFPLGR